MADPVRAAVRVGPGQTEVREFPLPEVTPDAGLLRIEAAGICGSDLGSYWRPLKSGSGHIMGHENVGVVAAVGPIAAERWGVKEGDRVALEEYLPCGHCIWCRTGDFRMCYQTDIHNTPNAVRYGTTPVTVPPALWGGFGQYMYLHPASVFHAVPAHVPAEQATLALPLGNGWQWTYVDGGLRPGMSVLIQGPGQQGLGCVVAAHEAGAGCIIVAGLARDAERLRVAQHLGADHTINVEEEDLRERVMAITSGRGVDVVVDVAAANESTLIPALDVLNMKRGTLVVAAGAMEQTVADFPIGLIKLKYATLKAGRGHTYASVEKAIGMIASGKYPLHEMTAYRADLAGVDGALRVLKTGGVAAAIHASVIPG